MSLLWPFAADDDGVREMTLPRTSALKSAAPKAFGRDVGAVDAAPSRSKRTAFIASPTDTDKPPEEEDDEAFVPPPPPLLPDPAADPDALGRLLPCPDLPRFRLFFDISATDTLIIICCGNNVVFLRYQQQHYYLLQCSKTNNNSNGKRICALLAAPNRSVKWNERMQYSIL